MLKYLFSFRKIMAEDSPTRQHSNVPNDIYIHIGGFYDGDTNFEMPEDGRCYVNVYKNLDLEHGCVEHVIEVGGFEIEYIQKKSVDEFLRDIRQGIEKLVRAEGRKIFDSYR